MSATMSISAGATARIGASSAAPSSAGPRWAKRRCTTNCPRSGSGSSGSGGSRSSTMEVVVSSGSVSTHVR